MYLADIAAGQCAETVRFLRHAQSAELEILLLLIVIGKQTCNSQRHMVVMTAIVVFTMVTAVTVTMMMLRMNIGTFQSTDESSYEGTAAGIACMHVESYDTETVPYDKQHCAKSENPILHNNLQRYKNPSNGKGSCIYEKRGRIRKSFLSSCAHDRSRTYTP